MNFPTLSILVLCLFQLGFSCNKYSILDLTESDVLAKGTVVNSSGRILKFKVSKFIWGDSIPLVKNIVFFPSGIQEYNVDFEYIMEKDSLTSGVPDLGIDDSNFVDKTFYVFFAKSNSDTVIVRDCQQSGLINSIGDSIDFRKFTHDKKFEYIMEDLFISGLISKREGNKCEDKNNCDFAAYLSLLNKERKSYTPNPKSDLEIGIFGGIIGGVGVLTLLFLGFISFR